MEITPWIAAYRSPLERGEHRRRRRASSWDEGATRALDLGMASCLLAFFAPLMLIVAGAICLIDPGPIFQEHRRVGRHGRSFPCRKFRTMDADGWMTPLGTLLRKSGLDQLPRLFNVLRGEMSIVGPHPMAEREIGRHGRYFVHYSAVKPGLIGLRQVSRKSDGGYRSRIALDIAYARNKSLRLDLRIMALAIPAALLGHDRH